MAFSYHPPTRTKCPVCEKLLESQTNAPIIDTMEGRASAANGYPFHDWYNFVLGYTPVFPQYILDKEIEKYGNDALVVDPFNGSGTTQLVCKLNGIQSCGIDANDFMVFAASQKLNWSISTGRIAEIKEHISDEYNRRINQIDWDDIDLVERLSNENRPKALDKRYISERPLIKINIIRDIVSDMSLDDEYHNFFMFAISSILVPVSNVKYGPGFGVGKIKEDVDVISVLNNKLDSMIADLQSVSDEQKNTYAEVILGDSRRLSDYLDENSVSLMITSPPYPGDHEYTKHSKLELIFNGYATDVSSFRTIKKRMIRGSTTNIYKEDNEKERIDDIEEIKEVVDLIDERLQHDNATSGFEKLYTKLVKEYFGGMANTLAECYKVLKPGGKIALLVSDSHAFKMVHIQTAEILRIIGEREGFVNSDVILWQMKNSTSHKYQLRENILVLEKPQ